MKKYTVFKLEKLLLWLIPPILRKRTHFDWLNVLLGPIRTIYEETLYKMQHTGQVIYLEKVLNEAFNPDKVYNPNYSIERKREEELIYIEETVKPKLQFVYLNHEYPNLNIEAPSVFTHQEITHGNKKPMYLANVLDYTKVNYANFRVFIPESLNYKLSNSIGPFIRVNGQIVTVEPPTLEQLSNKLFFDNHPDPSKGIKDAIEVHTVKYHDLLNFYKLAGKTYESYVYATKPDRIFIPHEI